MEHENKSLKYTCSMHPEIIKDAPGNCPICNMNLILVKNTKGDQGHSRHEHQSTDSQKSNAVHDHSAMTNKDMPHDSGGHAHHEGMIDDFKKRFYVVLVLTIPIMALSSMIQQWLKLDWSFSGSNYILLVLSSIVYFYGAWPFLQGLAREVKAKLLGMMTLVGVAITVAYVYSVAVFFGLDGMDFFWELGTLILIMLSPAMGAVLMSVSTVVMAINARLLKV